MCFNDYFHIILKKKTVKRFLTYFTKYIVIHKEEKIPGAKTVRPISITFEQLIRIKYTYNIKISEVIFIRIGDMVPPSVGLKGVVL